MERSEFIDSLAIAQSKEDIIKGNISQPLSPAEIIVSNFEKGIISEEIFLGGLNVVDKLEKGKRAAIGEVREWSGKKFQKTANGWTPVKGDKTASSSKDETSSKFKSGDQVKIPNNLTSDTKKKQGQSGKIVSVDSKNEEVTVEFSDGVKGTYMMDAVEKQSSNKEEESDESVAKRSGISVEEYKKMHPRTREELKKIDNKLDEKKEGELSTKQLQVKPGSLTISGNKASGVIGDRKVSVSLSKDFMNSVSSFDDKGSRDKVRALLIDEYNKSSK